MLPERNSDTHTAVFRHSVRRKQLSFGIDDGHWRIVHLHQIYRDRRNLSDIPRHHVKIGSEKHQGLGFGTAFYLIHLRHSFLIGSITPDSPHGIRRIKQDSAGLQYLNSFIYNSLLIHI